MEKYLSPLGVEVASKEELGEAKEGVREVYASLEKERQAEYAAERASKIQAGVIKADVGLPAEDVIGAIFKTYQWKMYQLKKALSAQAC